MDLYKVCSTSHAALLRSSFREFYALHPVSFKIIFKDGISLSNGVIMLFSPLLSRMIGEISCCAHQENVPQVILADFTLRSFSHLTRLLFYGCTKFSEKETEKKFKVIQEIVELGNSLGLDLQSVMEEEEEVDISEYQFACSWSEQRTAEQRRNGREVKIEVKAEPWGDGESPDMEEFKYVERKSSDTWREKRSARFFPYNRKSRESKQLEEKRNGRKSRKEIRFGVLKK